MVNHILKKTTVFFGFLMVISVAAPAIAGPTLIKDRRVRDYTLTPFLGRGYSIATNTFQSSCMGQVELTDPSYNFQYNFTEVEYQAGREKSASASIGVKGSVGFWLDQEVRASSKAASKMQMKSHDIVVSMRVYKYYASVNEAKSKLSESANNLLVRQDLPGFFAACGPYYTRGITRTSDFFSIFNYQDKSSESNVEFSMHLKQKINAVFVKRSTEVSMSASLKNFMSETKTTIVTRGWGIGPNESGSMAASDVGSFKTAVLDAFISMQNPLVGRVNSIEVVPWVENTEFQDLVNLEGDDVAKDGQKVPMYKKKDILTQNAEFMAEVWRSGRAKLNSYYKASICRSTINAKYYLRGALQGWARAVQLKNHRTGQVTQPPVTVGELDLLLDDEMINNYADIYESFMYSGNPNAVECIDDMLKDPNNKGELAAAAIKAAAAEAAPKAKTGKGDGADAAEDDEAKAGKDDAATTEANLKAAMAKEAAQSEGRGLFLHRYLSIESCQKLYKKMVEGVVLDEKIDDHCMPQAVWESDW